MSRVHNLSNSKPDSDATLGCIVVLVIIVLLRLNAIMSGKSGPG